jgi:hypothetical protein
MAQKFYRAGFEKQGTGTPLAWKNCAAASGAMLVDQGSLRLKNPSPDAFRKATGDFVGGLEVSQVASTCEKYGVPVHAYDWTDNLTWDQLTTFIKRGQFAVVAGDYETLPYALKGDKNFTGDHSVLFGEIVGTKIRVGDPLNDGRRPNIPKGYIWWPLSEARQYVMKYTQNRPGGIYATVLDRRRLRARPVSPNTRVRATATRDGKVIGSFGGTTTVIYGGTVVGESIGGNRTWFRIWWPQTASFGYCHASVVARV